MTSVSPRKNSEARSLVEKAALRLEGCGAPATKSVQTVGEHGWIVIWFCQRHCEAFQADTVERRDDEVK